MPDDVRQDPTWPRSGHTERDRDGCRVPMPWEGAQPSYGLAFSFMLTAEMLGIVLAGVWADRRGPLPSLFAGQLLMAAGSAMAGLAPTFAVLLAGRLVAGLGAGLIVVALYVVIGRAYPDALRPRVFSWVSAA